MTAVLTVPRARWYDGLRIAASLAFAGVFAVPAVRAENPWIFLPLAAVLLANALFLGAKVADRRPALVATAEALEVFRFPGRSARLPWPCVVEIAYLKMRVKRVLFVKATVPEAPSVELASTDFRGDGGRIADRLRSLRARYA